MEDFGAIQKYEIFLNAVSDTGFTVGYGILQQDNTLSTLSDTYFYLPIYLKKTYDIYEYVDITKDQNVFTIDRQEINPFFIEFSFFDTIIRNKVIHGIDLTMDMVDFIKSKRSETSGFTYKAIKS